MCSFALEVAPTLPETPVLAATRRILPALAIALAVGTAAQAEPIYVAPGGDDRAAGTRERPLASLRAAVRRVADRNTPQEIVLRAGVYAGGITIAPRADPPPLLIRAEQRSDESWEDVMIDGADRIDAADSVRGKPGVFRVRFSAADRSSLGVWEADTRIRYRRLADLPAVERVPASFVIADGQIYLHTSDGRPPAGHRIGRARDLGGILVLRRHVTLRGLQFRHFALERRSYAIRADVGDVIVEDCRIWNVRRGIVRGAIRPSVGGLPYGADERDLHVRRCRADQVGVGFFGQGGVSLVEDSQFFYRPGPFEIPEYSQDQSGIQSYYPASGAEVRRNLIVGFNSGIFFKSPGTHYLVEQNTIVGTGDSAYGMGRTSWTGRSLFRSNLVTGFRHPILQQRELPPVEAITGNLIWWPAAKEPRLGRNTRRLAEWLDRANVNAEPRFADPSRDDYRLLPESVGASLGPEGAPLGARGLANDDPEALLPPVAGALPDASSSFDRSAILGLRRIEPAFVPHAGPPRAWYVDPNAGEDEPAEGTQDRPLRTLQLALNHANPGDRVVLQPGLYLGQHVLAHGGREGAPIVIEASPAGGAVLDGLKERESGSILTIRDAPHVIVRGLEVRWFQSVQFGGEAAGISIERSPHVAVRDCEVWNDAWTNDRATGIGIRALEAPYLVIEGCVVYAVDVGFAVQASPFFRITRNTVGLAGHHGARFVDSLRESVFEGNSLGFSGSYLVSVRATPDEMASFRSDYNNLAANVRGVPAARRPSSDFFRGRESKAVGIWNDRRLVSLADWQAATGKDARSISQHPRYADPESRDFRPSPGSPNRAAGPEGGSIGALGF